MIVLSVALLVALAGPRGARACTLVSGGADPDRDMMIAPLDTEGAEKTMERLGSIRAGQMIEAVSLFKPFALFVEGAWSSRGPRSIKHVPIGTRVRLVGRYAVSVLPAAPVPYLLAAGGGCGKEAAIPLDRTLAVKSNYAIIEGTLVSGQRVKTGSAREILPFRLINVGIVAQGKEAFEKIFERDY